MASNFSTQNISAIQLNGQKYNIKSVPFHGTEAEWTNNDYIPKQGEIIIYDKDGNYDYERIKIGNGEFTADELDFFVNVNQPDWNQNDETAVDYIKNRPFYSEKDIAEIIPETTTTGDGQGAQFLFTEPLDLVIGKTYTITIDGVEHECVGKDFGSIIGAPFAICALGNLSVINSDLDNTGETFVLAGSTEMIEDGMYGTAIVLSANTEVTLSVKGNNEIIHHIDPKYIKDMYYTEEGAGTTILSFSQVQWEDDNGDGVNDMGTFSGVSFDVGTYTVMYNGITYTCEASDGSALVGGDPCIVMGNIDAVGEGTGLPSTDCPFIIMYAPTLNQESGFEGMIMFVDGSTPESFTVMKSGDKIHYIDPKYIEEMYRSEVITEEPLKDQVFDLDASGLSVSANTYFELVEGATYTVTWNGNDYECVAQTVSDVIISGVGLSEEGVFVIIPFSGNDTRALYIKAKDGSKSTQVTISIKGTVEKIKQVPEKYIPNTIARAEDIPVIDEYLSDSSENPVQNKTVASALGSKLDSFKFDNFKFQLERDLVGKRTVSGTVFNIDGVDYTAKNYAEYFNYNSNKAIGDYSHAEGYNTNAIGDNSHAEGSSTKSLGNSSHAEGYQTTASGLYSHTEGIRTTASGEAAHAEGAYNVIASGNNSHAEGSQTTASGAVSHAEGHGTTASGLQSHAEGHGTTAIGEYSHAEGYSHQPVPSSITQDLTNDEIIAIWNEGHPFLLARGEAAHAEGYSTLALDRHSHAEGHKTIASFWGAHAEGIGTVASNRGSHAEGELTTALGLYSHAEGEGTIASGRASHVQGEYNIEDTEKEYLHIVGNGRFDNERSNAHTIDFNGNSWFAGDVYVGSTSGTNKDAGSKKLATENYVYEQLSNLELPEGVVVDPTLSISGQAADAKAVKDALALKAKATDLANYVPKTTTINNKTLSGNISLSAADVGADPAGTAEDVAADVLLTVAANLETAKDYADAKVDALVGSAPGTLDTIYEIADALKDNADIIDTLAPRSHYHTVSHTPAGTVSKPTFSGTQATISADYTPEGTVSKPTFSGTQATISTTYTPAGTVSKPTFTGTAGTASGKFTPAGTVSKPTFTGTEATISISHTPAGTVSKPTFTGTAVNTGAAGGTNGTTTVYSITGVGSLPSATYTAPTHSFTAPSLTMSASNRTLNITFSAGSSTFTAGSLDFKAGSLPTRSSGITVATGTHVHEVTAAGTVSQPTFTGTAATVSTKYTPAGSVSQPTFSGTEGNISASYTPSGTVSQPTFSGTQATISTTYTPAGSVSQPTFTGEEATISTSYTPAGSVSQPTFTGTAATVNSSTTQIG